MYDRTALCYAFIATALPVVSLYQIILSLKYNKNSEIKCVYVVDVMCLVDSHPVEMSEVLCSRSCILVLPESCHQTCMKYTSAEYTVENT
jgi:hypothetical protein